MCEQQLIYMQDLSPTPLYMPLKLTVTLSQSVSDHMHGVVA